MRWIVWLEAAISLLVWVRRRVNGDLRRELDRRMMELGSACPHLSCGLDDAGEPVVRMLERSGGGVRSRDAQDVLAGGGELTGSASAVEGRAQDPEGGWVDQRVGSDVVD